MEFEEQLKKSKMILVEHCRMLVELFYLGFIKLPFVILWYGVLKKDK